ncbi:hypothetical protein QW131_08920 [Roseibium salinum]|nr:hypothetical protein [Roseibium salinum]
MPRPTGFTGGQGDDTLIGGTGNDTLYGEDGSDLFMYGLGDGSDMIHGGEGTAWTDAIDLGGSSGTASAGDYGSDWTVTITDGSIMNTDTATNVMELSQDADGYIDFFGWEPHDVQRRGGNPLVADLSAGRD